MIATTKRCEDDVMEQFVLHKGGASGSLFRICVSVCDVFSGKSSPVALSLFIPCEDLNYTYVRTVKLIA